MQLTEFSCCPYCHHNLENVSEGLHCPRCKTTFPQTEDGIILFKKRLVDQARSQPSRPRTRLERVTDVFTELSDQYDRWFIKDRGKMLFPLELEAIRRVLRNLPSHHPSLEVGVGTGQFAAALGIDIGIDPSLAALRLAKQRGIHVMQGIGEQLPFKDETFDVVLVVVTICFFRDVKKALEEIHRVLKPEGRVVVGFIPLDSPWGKAYQRKKEQGHPFYKDAILYETNAVTSLLENTKFTVERAASTLLDSPSDSNIRRIVKDGLINDAGFVVLRGKKRPILRASNASEKNGAGGGI